MRTTSMKVSTRYWLSSFILIAICSCCCLLKLTKAQVDNDESCQNLQLKNFVRDISETRFETHKIKPKRKQCETFVERVRNQNSGVLHLNAENIKSSSNTLNEIAAILEARCLKPFNGLNSLLEFVGDCSELLELSERAAAVGTQIVNNERITELESKLKDSTDETVKLKEELRELRRKQDEDSKNLPGNVREISVTKDYRGQVGITLTGFQGSAFVSEVAAGSPAALAGLRFGDQVIARNGHLSAGVYPAILVSAQPGQPGSEMNYLIRRSPYEQTIVIKARGSQVGFEFKKGKVVSVTASSPAARAGLLTDAKILTINGRSVIGAADKEIKRLLTESELPETKLTVMLSSVFDKIYYNS